jgi:hypothetical protein
MKVRMNLMSFPAHSWSVESRVYTVRRFSSDMFMAYGCCWPPKAPMAGSSIGEVRGSDTDG